LFKSVKSDLLGFGNFEYSDVENFGSSLAQIMNEHCRALSPAFLPRIRRICLDMGRDVIFSNSITNINSALLLQIQLAPLRDLRAGVCGMLLHQLFCDRFFDQLRTKEQLGYIVSHKFKEDSGSYSLLFLLQSAKSPGYLYTKICSFLQDMKVFSLFSDAY
jgi:insulysin